MEDAGRTLTMIVAAIVGLAILSVIVGRNSKAPAVIQSAAGALSSIVSAAVSPGALGPPLHATGDLNIGANVLTKPGLLVPTAYLPGLTGG